MTQEPAAEISRSALLEFGRRITAHSAPEEDTLPGRISVPALRSILYVPGNRRDWIHKCHRFGADAITRASLMEGRHPQRRDGDNSG